MRAGTVLALVFFAATGAWADLTSYEGFNYAPGSSLSGQNGGTGWSGGWFTPGGLDATVTAQSLSFGGLGFSGGAVSTAGFQPPNQGSSVAFWMRDLSTPLGADGTTVYLSFLLRPDAGYGFYGGINFGNLFVGRSGNQSSYGLEGPVNDINLSTSPVVGGQTVLLVLEAQFLAGDDNLSLFVNPAPGQSQPAVPDAVKTDLDVGTVTDVVLNNYGGYTYDEIRIGSTFASVTATPEPAFGAVLGGALLCLAAWKWDARRILRHCGAPELTAER